jgi:hypothetical protein
MGLVLKRTILSRWKGKTRRIDEREKREEKKLCNNGRAGQMRVRQEEKKVLALFLLQMSIQIQVLSQHPHTLPTQHQSIRNGMSNDEKI